MIQTTDTSEGGLEALIEAHFTGPGGYVQGHPQDFDPVHALDPKQLFLFLRATKPDEVQKLERAYGERHETQFVQRLHKRLRQKGLLYVLRHGVRDRDARLRLFFPRPAFEASYNPDAWERYRANRFSVTRQVRFDPDDQHTSVDIVLFVNGLPVATMELKNRLTGQTVEDAVHQYRTRKTTPTLFQFKRALVHFAVDDELVYMTTRLDGADTFFLPFNRGDQGGAGNPPNPDGLATAYLWEDVFQKDSLNDLQLKYGQVITEENDAGVTKEKQIVPRYHQRDAVQKLLAHAEAHGAGHRYLVQHSAGSGKSFTMTWLAHQLVELTDPARDNVVFDTIIVVTDRVHLDRQMRDYLQQMDQQQGVVEAITEGAQQLRRALEGGKKIITSTVQKFPHVVEGIGRLPQTNFAIIIDEAHSSQGGSFTAAMHRALGDAAKDAEIETAEDAINALIESRKLLSNASYFAFTATPKEKTLELFGGGGDTPRPFHTYTMRQAIEEGFILDVLENYTTYSSFYKLLLAAEDDPHVDKKLAHKKLRYYVETHEHAVKQKAQLMADHFLDEVIRKGKVGGEARAMVVTKSRELAIRYFWAISSYLRDIDAKWKPIVAFSDSIEVDGQAYDEAKLNGFPSKDIEKNLREDPYRFLVVADKFQTGFDEPLLHTMYVDKALGGVRAVQTLSRLNRQHPEKKDTFVLDFQNSTDTIQKAFDAYYTTTLLSETTDPNKLADLQEALDEYAVYTRDNVRALTDLYVEGAERGELDPILGPCLRRFKEDLTPDEQADFKAKVRSFKRTYAFLSQIITFSVPYWERLYWFTKLLLPKLPALRTEDRAQGIRESIDMDSYRVQKEAVHAMALDAGDAALGPLPTEVTGRVADPQMAYLSHVVDEFNDRFGTKWTEDDKIRRFLFEDLPDDIASDEAFVTKMRSSDRQNAKITLDEKVEAKFQELIRSHTDLYKKFTDDPDFKAFVQSMVFKQVYEQQ